MKKNQILPANNGVKTLAIAISAVAGVASVNVQALEKKDYALEEVVVTAQKRAESLQDVPMSVNSISDEALQNAGVASLDEVKQLVPALNIYSAASPAMTSVVLRGAGTGASDPTLEPSVGIFVDGVFMPRSVFGLSDLVDVDRVEVLMGPQGTLYGKNTNAGVVSVATKGAPSDFESQMKVTLGDYNLQETTIAVGDALTETFGYRFAATTRRRDGFMDNEVSGDSIYSQLDRQSYRGQLFWQPTDELYVRAIGYRSVADSNSSEAEKVFNPNSAFYAYSAGLANALTGTVPGIDGSDRKFSLTSPNPGPFTVGGGSVQVEYSLASGLTLTSITAYQNWEQSDQFNDGDGTILPILSTNDQMEESSYSQEFRITSPGGEKVDWLAGLFYFKSDLRRGSMDTPYAQYGMGLPTLPGLPADALYGQWLPFSGTGSVLDGLPAIVAGDYAYWQNKYNTESIAAFAQATWNLTDATSVTAGLRYGQETKDFGMHVSVYDADGTEYSYRTDPLFVPYGISDGSYSGGYFGPLTSGSLGDLTAFDPFGVGPVNRSGDHTDDDLSGMLSLNHNIGDTLLYATVATGNKSGGFNGSFGPATIEDREFDQEKTISYELGAKIDGLMDGRARLNMAYFYTQYKDFQAATFDPVSVSFFVQNAGEQVTQGVDLDLTYMATENLTLTSKLEYLDAKYVDFQGATCHDLAGGPGCDLSGKRMPFAPNWAGALAADYVKPLLAGGEAYAHVGLSFRTDYMADPTYGPYAADTSYQLWDARLGWRTDRWDLSLWGKNLTDELYTQVTSGNPVAGLFKGVDGGLSSTNYNRWINDPRMIGVTASYTF